MTDGWRKLTKMVISLGCGAVKGTVILRLTVLCAACQFSVENLDCLSSQKCQIHLKLAKTACSDNQSRITFGTSQCSETSQRVNTVGSAVKSCSISLSNTKEDTTCTKLKLSGQQRQQHLTLVSGRVMGWVILSGLYWCGEIGSC